MSRCTQMRNMPCPHMIAKCIDVGGGVLKNILY
jgi:hypothetical protein